MIRITIILVILIIIIMTFSIKMLDYGPYKIVILYADLYNNIGNPNHGVKRIDLLPNNVTLIQTSLGQAFFCTGLCCITFGSNYDDTHNHQGNNFIYRTWPFTSAKMCFAKKITLFYVIFIFWLRIFIFISCCNTTST